MPYVVVVNLQWIASSHLILPRNVLEMCQRGGHEHCSWFINRKELSSAL